MRRIRDFICGIDPAITEAISFITACSILMFLLFAPVGAQAATKSVRTPVYGVISSDRYGGCMIQVGDFAESSGLWCPDGNPRTWLTLDCDGNWLQRTVADRNFRTAQMALLTEKRVTLTIDDTKKAGNYCLARQVTLFR